MSRLVIGLVGRKGSGKGTVAKILKERYGASVYRFSDMLRDVLDAMHLEQSRENLIRISEILRSEFGEGVLKNAMVKKVAADSNQLVVIDGLRRLDDLTHLDELGEFRLIDVHVPAEIRFERLKSRGENAGESTRTFASFMELENASTEVTIGDVEAHAWKKIENSGDQAALIATIDSLMAELNYAGPRH